MNRDALADLLSSSDPFLVTATQALTATDGRERLPAIQRLFELRAEPASAQSPSDRALRLFATGCLYLVQEESERRDANKGESRVPPTTGCGSRSHPGDVRRRRPARPPRNVRTQLRLLFSAIRVCGVTSAADSNDPTSVAAIDQQKPARALLQAIVDDGRTWQADPLFRDELDALLTDPATRARRVRGGS